MEWNIGKNLRKERKKRDLTLDEVAIRCEVSKPMLSQIERGISSPTLQTVWKIATGLKIPLTDLLMEEEGKVEVRSYSSIDPLVEEDGKMVIYPLFKYDPIRNVEVFLIEFKPDCIHRSLAHASSVEELVLIEQGELQMQIGSKRCELKEKEAVRFQADQEHVYQNLGTTSCWVYDVIFY